MKSVFKFLERNKLIYILIALQIAAVFALIIIFTSAVRDRTAFYSVCKNALSGNGIIIKPSSAENKMHNEKDILKIFDKAKNISGVKSLNLFNDSYDFQGVAMFYSSNDMRKIPPFLKSGTCPDDNSDLIECLASEASGFKTGDIIKLHDDKNKEYTIKICGILSYNQYIFGTGIPGEYRYNGNYKDLYYYLSKSGDGTPLLLTTENIAKKYDMNPTYRYDSSVIITFSEDAYDSEILNVMAFDNGFEIMNNTESMNKASINYINEQLYTMLPLAIAILIITIFTAVTTSIISTTRNLRSYASYYLCGATWKYCARINLGIYFFVTLLSIAADFVFFIIGSYTFLKNTVVSINSMSLILCGSIAVLFLLLSLFIPLITVKNTQPRDVLKR